MAEERRVIEGGSKRRRGGEARNEKGRGRGGAVLSISDSEINHYWAKCHCNEEEKGREKMTGGEESWRGVESRGEECRRGEEREEER